MNEQPLPIVRAAVVPEIKAINTEKREIVHVVTSMSTDRAGDVVEPGGADVENFLRNPVVLADHDYSINSIIGRAETLEIGGDSIVARTTFDDGGLGSEAFRLVKNGMARAWSIGFRPVEHESIKDEKGVTRGFRFKKWELLEYSLVAIPMNPDALNNCIQRGAVDERFVHKFFDLETDSADRAEESARPDATPERDPSPFQLASAGLRNIVRGIVLQNTSKR